MLRHPTVITARIRFAVPRFHAPLQASTITPRLNFSDLEVRGPNVTLPQHIADRQQDNLVVPTPAYRVIKPADDERESSENKSNSEDHGNEETLINDASMIPKPQGEPGRPRSGGYSIQKELKGWTGDLYTEVKVSESHNRFLSISSQQLQKFVQDQAKALLDEKRSFTHQDQKRLENICNAVSIADL